jgi:hypothetical protein
MSVITTKQMRDFCREKWGKDWWVNGKNKERMKFAKKEMSDDETPIAIKYKKNEKKVVKKKIIKKKEKDDDDIPIAEKYNLIKEIVKKIPIETLTSIMEQKKKKKIKLIKKE